MSILYSAGVAVVAVWVVVSAARVAAPGRFSPCPETARMMAWDISMSTTTVSAQVICILSRKIPIMEQTSARIFTPLTQPATGFLRVVLTPVIHQRFRRMGPRTNFTPMVWRTLWLLMPFKRRFISVVLYHNLMRPHRRQREVRAGRYFNQTVQGIILLLPLTRPVLWLGPEHPHGLLESAD